MHINLYLILGATFEALTVLVASAKGFLLSLKRLMTYSEPKSLKNETILVTGGSSGIGRSILETVASLETDVTLISWDIDSASNEAMVEKLQSLGVKRTVAMTVDVKNKNQVSAAAARVRREFGNVTMLFNIAGINGPVGRCWETDLDDQEMTMQVNFMSHLYTLREFLPWMVENNRGHVIATCSMVGFCYLNNGAPYIAAKHAILGYYNCLKEDLRVTYSNVHVSLVYPGIIDTNMIAPYDNIAGINGPVGRCWETDLDHQELTIQVNLTSHLYTLREFLPWMVQNNRGHVIATCSCYGFCYVNNLAPYVAAKHAISGYYNCLKEDLRVASSNVRVSLVYRVARKFCLI